LSKIEQYKGGISQTQTLIPPPSPQSGGGVCASDTVLLVPHLAPNRSQEGLSSCPGEGFAAVVCCSGQEFPSHLLHGVMVSGEGLPLLCCTGEVFPSTLKSLSHSLQTHSSNVEPHVLQCNGLTVGTYSQDKSIYCVASDEEAPHLGCKK